MTGALAAIGFVLILILVILIHEASHFLMAKRFDIKVEEFFVGFGPRLWSRPRGETEYGVKAILLGGYVKIAGMNPFEEISEEDRPRTFGARPAWQRALVIVAGPISHFVMAFLVLALYLAIIGQPTTYAAVVSEVTPKLDGIVSPAAAGGLQAGDRIVSIDGQLVDDASFSRALRANTSLAPMTVVVDRGGEDVTLTISPVMAEDDEGLVVPRFGILLSAGPVLTRDRPGPIAAVGDAASLLASGTVQVVKSFGRVFGPEGFGRLFRLIFGDAQRTVEDPVTVVGAARLAGQVAESGQFDMFVALFVSFNIFIGLLNLLPLPPFDGGHLAVLAIEKVSGKKVDMRKMIPVSAVVLAVFGTFMIATLYLDLFKPVPNLFP